MMNGRILIVIGIVVTGGHCPPNYPANIQDDGSAVVGVTTWDADTKKENRLSLSLKTTL